MSDMPPPLPPEWEAFVEASPPATMCADPEAPVAFWVARMLREGFSREQIANMLMREAEKVVVPLERKRRLQAQDAADEEQRKKDIQARARAERAWRRATQGWAHNPGTAGGSAFWGGV